MPNIAKAQGELRQRIVEGDGVAPSNERQAAFNNAGLPEPLKTLVDKVANHAHTIDDRDFAAAMESGRTEDQLFEVVVCAAVGQATRQYQAALAALDAATAKDRRAT
jgi:hypothetical protein